MGNAKFELPTVASIDEVVMQIDFERAFEAVASAMVQAANERSVLAAEREAERVGLVKQGDGKPSQITIWEVKRQSTTLWFQWRWYDQSQAFSIQPDMNIMLLELREGDKILRRAEQHYED